MRPIVIKTAAEQVAEHLRGELLRGVWQGAMPGSDRVAAGLGVGKDTAEAALRILEDQGLLVNQGRRRGRLIRITPNRKPTSLKVGILAWEKANTTTGYMAELQHDLERAGHAPFIASRFLSEMGMDVARAIRLVKREPADAWVVMTGNLELLEWFAKSKIPAIALFGRRRQVALAGVGPNKVPAFRHATRHLIGLGHRRIALLCRKIRRLPVPGAPERAFLSELKAHGILPSPSFHLPDWEENIDGFHGMLESLFRLTPPTALIVDEIPFFLAVNRFLATRGIRVPDDLSLVCTDYSPDFDWCRPSVAHIRWDIRPMVRHIIRWMAQVSRGREDRQQEFTRAEFVDGGTVGPAAS